MLSIPGTGVGRRCHGICNRLGCSVTRRTLEMTTGNWYSFELKQICNKTGYRQARIVSQFTGVDFCADQKHR